MAHSSGGKFKWWIVWFNNCFPCGVMGPLPIVWVRDSWLKSLPLAPLLSIAEWIIVLLGLKLFPKGVAESNPNAATFRMECIGVRPVGGSSIGWPFFRPCNSTTTRSLCRTSSSLICWSCCCCYFIIFDYSTFKIATLLIIKIKVAIFAFKISHLLLLLQQQLSILLIGLCLLLHIVD